MESRVLPETKTKRAIESAFRENRSDLLAQARRVTRDIRDAEDVVQEAFLSAMANIDVLGKVENIPGWLFQVIKNRVVDLWRRRRTRTAAGEIDVAAETVSQIIASTGLDPADECVRNELAGALGDAIAALPVEQRQVIEAQVLDGLTFQEMAARTGLPINTLMTRKKLAIKRLATALRGWIVD